MAEQEKVENVVVSEEVKAATMKDIKSFGADLVSFAPSVKSIQAWESILNEAAEMRKDIEDEKEKVHHHVSRKTLFSLILGYGYLILCAYVVGKFLYGFTRAFLFGDSNAVEPTILNVAVFAGGILVFMLLTVYDYWNTQVRARTYLIALTCVLAVTLASVWYKLSYAIVVPLLLLPEPNEYVTGAKWMFLIRILTIFPTVLLTFACIRGFVKITWDEFVLSEIEEFRLLEHLDLRKNKRFQYDITFLKTKFNGSRFVITEVQRFLHMIITGVTGTGKSSMVLEPMFNDDMKRRCRNEDKMISLAVKLLEKGKAYLNRRVEGRHDFDLSALTPTDEKAAKEIEKIGLTYRKIGYTALCPDSSMNDHYAKLAMAKGIDVNIVDPEYDEKTGKWKKGLKGFNPLYISPNVPAEDRESVIAERAVLVAEILTKLNALKGEGDPYFVGLNRTVTESIAITLLLTFPKMVGRQPNLVDIQLCINDFNRLKPYFTALKAINKDMDGHPFTFVCDFVGRHLLGEGQKDMNAQAKGLQMLVNEFLTQNRVRFLLCAPDDATIDMDEMLLKGQITVVNYAINLPEVVSTGFGLFFVLSFINATMRRGGNENTRIPHVFVVDELARCLHPDFEMLISLARKYRVSFVGAIQELAQFDKSPVTRYMEEVALGGCAHHIVFGRCGIKEMERYSKLAGKGWEHKEIETVSQTAITTDNPSYSYSTRTQLEEVDNLSGTDIHNKHFKECTVFTTRMGAPVEPFFAKVNFLEKSDYNTLKRKKYDWEELYSKYGIASTAPSEKTMEKVEEKLEKKNEEYADFDFSASLFGDESFVSFSSTGEEGETSTAEDGAENELAARDEAPAAVEVNEEKPKYIKLKAGYMQSDMQDEEEGDLEL